MTWWLASGLALLLIIRAAPGPALPADAKAAFALWRATSPAAGPFVLLSGAGPSPMSVSGQAIRIFGPALEQVLPHEPEQRIAAMVFLFGHEAGHDPERPDDLSEELEADSAGGAALRRAGFPVTAIDAVLVPMFGPGSHTHGTAAQRRAATIAGWARA